MKSFLIFQLFVSLICFNIIIYRAEIHQANPSMSGMDKSSVLVHAIQQIYGLSNYFATYRSAYWSFHQPLNLFNHTNEVCSSSIECLYDMDLVYNSFNATMACVNTGGFDFLNSTNSVSTALSQEWIAYISFRFFLSLFGAHLFLWFLLLALFIQSTDKARPLILVLFFTITMISIILIFISVIDHSVKPFTSAPNYIFGVILIVLIIAQWIQTLSSFYNKNSNFALSTQLSDYSL